MRRAREVESLLLAMFAALPLYFMNAISLVSLVVFHVFMGCIVLRVAMRKTPELVPARFMRWLAMLYVPFYLVDAIFLSRSAIAASTHLVLFIAAYQPIEAVHRNNQAQRILTSALIFIASLATSTHLTIIPFIVVFGFFMFRQLMTASHIETARSVGHEYADVPTGRTAGWYLAGAMAIGAMLFPLLPRLRSPVVKGLTGPLPGATTALSETINFASMRATPNDATVVARVWLDREARPFFTPLRLRGTLYDRYENGEWKQSLRGLRELPVRQGSFLLGRPGGVQKQAIVQMRAQRGKMFLPVGTYAVSGITNLYEGPARETYYTYDDGPLTIDVRLAYRPEPLRLQRMKMSNYPISPAVDTLARSIVGNETDPAKQAALIEQYMVRNFRYVPNTETAKPIPLERFLLYERAGHCEYYAAGMVALMNALGVPARIAGGFYGGQLNPLTGYYAIRREDAHAWTEVWDGKRWLTFDSTPPSLRPSASDVNPVVLYFAALGDSMTFFWDRYVLTFGLGDQVSLFSDFVSWAETSMDSIRNHFRTNVRGMFSSQTVSYAVLALSIALLVTFLVRRRRRLFDLLALYLSAQGIEVGPAMTMEEALRELRVQHPDAAMELQPLIEAYEEETFGSTQDPRRARALRRKLAELQT